jgi:Response regulators consisting of a CheY-like receiver domain and a winged-helix DNA-binding domain
MRILVVEDEPTLAAQLAATLQAAGYAVDTAANGRDAGYMGEVETFDAVVLDLGLPMVDGLTVLKRWRALGRTMPVLILTARGDWHEKVAGIDAGADDYLTKPFHMEELLARIRALIRRAAGQASAEIACGPLVLDTAAGASASMARRSA